MGVGSKITSGVIAIGYLVTAILVDGPELAILVGGFLIVPLACIWFSDAMGGYTGLNFFTRPAITESTPGRFVALGGWLLLLLPLVVGLVAYLTESK